jgi:hypothetical protein
MGGIYSNTSCQTSNTTSTASQQAPAAGQKRFPEHNWFLRRAFSAAAAEPAAGGHPPPPTGGAGGGRGAGGWVPLTHQAMPNPNLVMPWKMGPLRAAGRGARRGRVPVPGCGRGAPPAGARSQLGPNRSPGGLVGPRARCGFSRGYLLSTYNTCIKVREPQQVFCSAS